MIYDVNLKKVGERWEFENESDLEDFLWSNLSNILLIHNKIIVSLLYLKE